MKLYIYSPFPESDPLGFSAVRSKHTNLASKKRREMQDSAAEANPSRILVPTENVQTAHFSRSVEMKP